MRCFIGIEIPSEVKSLVFQFLVPLQKSLKGWERQDDYHLTLLFIGEIPEATVTIIKERMSKISFKPFTLEISHVKFFNRRIMYLDLSPSLELLKLHFEILHQFAEWVRPNELEFIPHITVKRWQRYEYNDLLQGVEEQKFKAVSFLVSSLALFKSERDETNKKYHVIYRTDSTTL